MMRQEKKKKMNDQAHLTELLKELKLKHFAQAMVTDWEQLKPDVQSVLIGHLSKWAQSEMAERKASIIAARIRSAKFRQLQSIDKFDFSYSPATKNIEKNYLSLYHSVTRDDLPNAVFTGTPGAGKTHLARSLGYAACQKGLTCLYTTAAEMVNRLSHAQKTLNLEAELNKYRRPQVLVIDELGYVTLDAQASNLFFQVISVRHDQGLGTIATTNIAFGKWNQIFANDAIAHAIIDRLANNAEIFYMEGPSYREHLREEKKKKAKKDS
jgi:DNA replication protein DnaC